MGFADLHIHSMYSYDGTASISAILKYVADYTDLNVIAITDHDSMEGVPEALDLAPYYMEKLRTPINKRSLTPKWSPFGFD